MTNEKMRESQRIHLDNWLERKKAEDSENARHAKNAELQKFVLLGFASIAATFLAVKIMEWLSR
jgi:hypothetical protein